MTKKNWARGLVAIFLAGIALLLLWPRERPLRNNTQESPASAPKINDVPDALELDNKPPQASRPAITPQSVSKMGSDMAEDEKAELANKFQERFKPAVEKWFSAYEGRIPFRQEDVTLDKFHSRLGTYMYTFMIGDTTFTIQDSKGVAKVSYLMTRKAAKELNQSPSQGFIPNLNVPITREEIIRMVKADSGVGFKPNEVIIKPTAAACALNGGAFVEILPAGADPNNGLSSKIDLVFDSDGKLVNYERDPFF